jgi:hypothetical protein
MPEEKGYTVIEVKPDARAGPVVMVQTSKGVKYNWLFPEEDREKISKTYSVDMKLECIPDSVYRMTVVPNSVGRISPFEKDKREWRRKYDQLIKH